MSNTTTKVTLEQRIEILEKTVAELQAKLDAPKAESKEMTDDHARMILNGSLKDKSHKDSASELGLTYGQIYSCRLQFTFKNIHKELSTVEGYKNRWVK